MNTCATCRHYEQTTDRFGKCHRYPPGESGFVNVQPAAYCGEYAVRTCFKNKIPPHLRRLPSDEADRIFARAVEKLDKQKRAKPLAKRKS